ITSLKATVGMRACRRDYPLWTDVHPEDGQSGVCEEGRELTLPTAGIDDLTGRSVDGEKNSPDQRSVQPARLLKRRLRLVETIVVLAIIIGIDHVDHIDPRWVRAQAIRRNTGRPPSFGAAVLSRPASSGRSRSPPPLQHRQWPVKRFLLRCCVS